VTKIVQKMC